ncbi:MAG: hypothetical protein H7836_04590 [Magnetococcus sp. YQC-3]
MTENFFRDTSRRVAREVVEIEYDPQSAEDCANMWLEIGDQFIKNNPKFAKSIIFAEKSDDNENYIIGMTSENEELHNLLDTYIFQKINNDKGPFANANMIQYCDITDIPEKFETSFGFAFITLW